MLKKRASIINKKVKIIMTRGQSKKHKKGLGLLLRFDNGKGVDFFLFVNLIQLRPEGEGRYKRAEFRKETSFNVKTFTVSLLHSFKLYFVQVSSSSCPHQQYNKGEESRGLCIVLKK